MIRTPTFSPASADRFLVVDLSIPAEEMVRYYAGQAAAVQTRARDGRRVRFPAEVLRPFVTREGVQGSFRIWFSPEGKFRRIERIA